MYKISVVCYAMLCLVISSFSQAGDTTIIQTYTHAAQNNPNTAYDSPGRRWFDFPPSDNGVKYQKILMYYNLKCFSNGTAGNLGFPCGEWDYLTYTYLFDHTGVIDSISATSPLYKVNNLDFDQAELTTQPIHVTREYLQDAIIIDDKVGETIAEIGTSSSNISGPFSENTAQRSLYLYRVEELLSAGLQAGEEIGNLGLFFSGAPSTIQMFKIELAMTTDTVLSEFYNENIYYSAYEHDTSIPADGWLEFSIGEGFIWDGTSSILVQMFHTNPDGQNTPLLGGEEKTYLCSHITSATDRYMKFDWQDEVKVPAAVFTDVSDEISISFWQYGDPSAQPQDGTIFEGVNSLNQRQLNAHLPWSNGRVYWDAGYDGGYDRIDKLASTVNYEGKWNNWCFTKNAATGSMKIFLNGVLWHSGTNLDNQMSSITKFSIGGATSWSNFYNGSIDEFAIFNKEIDASTILSWMNQDLDSNHPYWANLQVYYQFNELNGEMVLDASGNGNHAWMHGNAARIAYRGDEIWRNAGSDYSRPILRLSSGEYTTHLESSTGAWIEEIPPVSIAQYDVVNYQPIPVDVQYAWEEQNSYTIQASGDTINEILVPAEYTLNNEDFDYWQTPFEIVDRYELNRFITMYGIQLTLGSDGWTWVVDVTDWEPLLRDSVELESGNWQELLDMKFVFIEGTPARDVKRVERIWDRNVSLSTFDSQITNTVVQKLPGETMWKLATTNTGHGFDFDANNCGEFCNNIQSVDVNGQAQWSWDIIQECSTNPLYPQGGSWIYDRAGWCPGMNSATKEFELTPFVETGDSFTVDYDIEYDPYGNYVFFATLFGYGPPNHQHDPEIDMITAPSDWKIHSRWNPMCNNPKFILRNKGAMPLTDLNIYFGVVGGAVQTYHWTGNLAFLESEEVELTSADALMWQGDDGEPLTFFIDLGLSTDGIDLNPSNNYAESHFYRPPVYQYSQLDDNRLIIQLKTNLANSQTSYTLYDINGNVVFSRDYFPEPSTTYRDTLALNSGCYMFHLKDSGEDGLYYYFNDDGVGTCKFDRVGSFDLHSFENDFGKEIIHYFYWNTNLVSVQEMESNSQGLRVFPNPASQSCQLNIVGFERKVDIAIYDQFGRLCRNEFVNRKAHFENINLDISMLARGIYSIHVTDGEKSSVVKLMKE